jgi:hypothetical protein
MSMLYRIGATLRRFRRIPGQLEFIQEALGRIESRLQDGFAGADALASPRDFEFRVFSQWGEDGIVEHLVKRVPIVNETFVEFGVETYVEANTLFLLRHRNWRGLVIDGSARNVESIRRASVLWRYNLLADCAFLTRDNINEVISRNGVAGDIGLLSIDIDGNDYWVWQAITCVDPRIVISEYNGLFGPEAKVSVPYQPDFQRSVAHRTCMWYGASIAALEHLARTRGYSLVAGNSAGNNAFFVRNDCLGNLRVRSAREAYVAAAFREARAADGSVEFLSFAERQLAIRSMPVVDVVTGRQDHLETFL